MRYIYILSLLVSMSFQLFAQQRGADPGIVSPEILRDNSVIFRLNAPNATSVKLIPFGVHSYALQIKRNKQI